MLLLDAMSLLFRSFFALPDMRTAEGVPTGGLYGLSSLLIKLIREHEPRGLAFAVDLPEPTFRHAAFGDYKAQRQRAPSPLVQQLRRLPELMAALGAPVHGVPGFEADDVLATLARKASEAGHPVLVVTGDTDLFQITTDQIAVWYVGRRQKDALRMDADAVRGRYGVEPAQIPTWKALVGDPSDNLPGLAGVGKKTASRWIVEHGNAAGIVAAAPTLKPARLGPAVAEHGADLELWEDLATVRSELGVAVPHHGPFEAGAKAALASLYTELAFKSLLPRLDALPTA